MVSDEVTASLAKFFDGGIGPSHDELDRLVERAGLSAADPRKDDPVAGKMKRVRAVLWYASENDEEAGAKLVSALISSLRAAGSFRPAEQNYAGAATIEALRQALDAIGYDLSPDGVVSMKSIEGLESDKLTDALRAYVRRARTAGDDSALRLGTAKDLTEATARHVLIERVGTYPSHGNFPTTLWQAYDNLGLATPTQDAMNMLTGDAWQNIEQAALLLACAVNRYRNEQGTGHGRPHACLTTPEQGRIAAEASALVSELLLEALS